MRNIPLVARVLFGLIFLINAPFMFNPGTASYVSSKGLPLASILVPCAGILAFIGGLGVVIGYKAKWAALMLIAFLVPVNFIMNDFWTMTDVMQRNQVMSSFMKDIALIGGALFISYFGAGPLSFDHRNNRQT